MIMITAYVQPFRLENVRSELLAQGILGMTVDDVSGHGRNAARTVGFRGEDNICQLLPKVKIEVAVNDDVRDVALQAIIAGARLGQFGDGKIFVTNLERVVTIRTGCIDGEALDAPQAVVVEAAE